MVRGNYNNFFQESSEAEYIEFSNISSENMQNLEYKIDYNLLLEMILNDARNVTISYTVAKSSQARELKRIS